MQNFDPQSVLNDLILVESHLSILNARIYPDTSDSQIAVVIGRLRAGLAINGLPLPTRFSSEEELKRRLELSKKHLIQLMKPTPQPTTHRPASQKSKATKNAARDAKIIREVETAKKRGDQLKAAYNYIGSKYNLTGESIRKITRKK